MKLTYFGHCAFRWETPGGVTVMADPYRNQAGRYWFTRLFPDVHCDLGLVSHAHFDHDAVGRLPEAASILRMPGEFAVSDLRIRGIGDFHSGSSRLSGFPNVMFRLEAGGVSFTLACSVVRWALSRAPPPLPRAILRAPREPSFQRRHVCADIGGADEGELPERLVDLGDGGGSEAVARVSAG